MTDMEVDKVADVVADMVLDMEDDKVADELENMGVDIEVEKVSDKVVDMAWVTQLKRPKSVKDKVKPARILCILIETNLFRKRQVPRSLT